MTDKLPTHSLSIVEPIDSWELQMLSFAKHLEDQGERTWFEVRWPAPKDLSEEEKVKWLAKQEEVYDAVEVIDGEIVTLPPYGVLLGEEEYAPEEGFGQ